MFEMLFFIIVQADKRQNFILVYGSQQQHIKTNICIPK